MPYDSLSFDDYSKVIRKAFGEDMRFSVVVGNPPYQNSNGGGSIYQDFGCSMYDLTGRYMLLICPDRWNLSTQSSSFDNFRTKIVDSNNLSILVHIASDNGRTFVFKDAGTKDLTYFLVDKLKKSDDCTLIELDSDGNKLDKSNIKIMRPFFYSVNFMNILSKIAGRCTKFLDNVEGLTYAELDNINESKCVSVQDSKHTLKVYGTRGLYGYINLDNIKHDYVSLNKWKVLLPRNGVSPIVGEPESLAARTYYMFYFDSELEARNCCEYFKTRFFRFMLNTLKNGLYASKSAYSYIPYMNFSRTWSDEDLISYFGFSDVEIAYIIDFS